MIAHGTPPLDRVVDVGLAVVVRLCGVSDVDLREGGRYIPGFALISSHHEPSCDVNGHPISKGMSNQSLHIRNAAVDVPFA